MPRMTIEVRIARPAAEVLAWWTGFPDDYRATDPREQPHRIRVVARAPGRLELRTYWRVPLLGELVIPETMHLVSAERFEVDVHFPLGLAQHDTFTLHDESGGEGGGTRVTIELVMWPRNLVGRLMAPLYWHLYGRRMYPRTFREAGRLCERDAASSRAAS